MVDRRGSAGAGATAAAAITALATIALVVLAFVLGPPVVREPDWMRGDVEPVPQPVVTQPEATAAPDQSQDLDRNDPADAVDLAIPWPILVALAIVLLIALAYRNRARLRASLRRLGGPLVIGTDLEDEVEPDLHDAARAARGYLVRPGVPGHEAVIRAWLTLESAAAESGTPRRPAETPSEFTAHLLAAQHADAAATRRLLALYHRARFAARPHLDDDDVAAAVAALDAIVDSLAGQGRMRSGQEVGPP